LSILTVVFGGQGSDGGRPATVRSKRRRSLLDVKQMDAWRGGTGGGSSCHGEWPGRGVPFIGPRGWEAIGPRRSSMTSDGGLDGFGYGRGR
jgi:hypothetical protein